MLLLLLWGVSSCELLSLGLAYLRKAMLLLLGLLGGANSTLLVNSINTLLTYLQDNSSLVFTNHDTIAFIQAYLVLKWSVYKKLGLLGCIGES